MAWNRKLVDKVINQELPGGAYNMLQVLFMRIKLGDRKQLADLQREDFLPEISDEDMPAVWTAINKVLGRENHDPDAVDTEVYPTIQTPQNDIQEQIPPLVDDIMKYLGVRDRKRYRAKLIDGFVKNRVTEEKKVKFEYVLKEFGKERVYGLEGRDVIAVQKAVRACLLDWEEEKRLPKIKCLKKFQFPLDKEEMEEENDD